MIFWSNGLNIYDWICFMFKINNTPDVMYDIHKWNKCSNVKYFTHTARFHNLFTPYFSFSLRFPLTNTQTLISVEIHRSFPFLHSVLTNTFIFARTLFSFFSFLLYAFATMDWIFQISITTINGSCTFLSFFPMLFHSFSTLNIFLILSKSFIKISNVFVSVAFSVDKCLSNAIFHHKIFLRWSIVFDIFNLFINFEWIFWLIHKLRIL